MTENIRFPGQVWLEVNGARKWTLWRGRTSAGWEEKIGKEQVV
jgi:hypothetical protein